jgi:tetratricopeptide (TPR) repeat protein
MDGENAEEGLALAREAAEYLDEHGDAVESAAAHDRLALALAHLGRWAEALTAVDRAAEGADADLCLATRVAVHRAHILEKLDRPEEFRAAAEHARQLARETGVGELIGDAAMAYARSAAEPAEAVAACDEALPYVEPENRLPMRVLRARALLAANQATEAVEDYVEAVTLCVEQGADGDAFLRWELANAYRIAGRLGEAAEVAEEAVLGLDRLGAQAEADRCRHLLAGIYADLGEFDSALAQLEQLARNLDGPDNLPHRAQVLEQAGGLLYDTDRDTVAAQRFGEAAEAYRLAGAAVDELRARRRQADALIWSGDVPAAVRAVAVVDELVTALTAQPEQPPVVTYEVALAAEVGARVLAGDGRPDEALDRLAGVPARLRSIEAFGEAAQVEVLTGEMLARAGRLGEAEPLLREALAGLPSGSRLAGRAAWLLARVLDELGRPDEAAAVREEHGLPPDEE